jgi:hypothetical protein
MRSSWRPQADVGDSATSESNDLPPRRRFPQNLALKLRPPRGFDKPEMSLRLDRSLWNRPLPDRQRAGDGSANFFDFSRIVAMLSSLIQKSSL